MEGRRVIELRVRRVEDLRTWWLDGYPQGGIFIPGVIDLSAGAEIAVRVKTEEPAATTLLAATVMWRRLPSRPGGGSGRSSGAYLRAGVGVAFDPSMRGRVLFIERLERGASHEGRTAFRYPTSLPGLLSLRPEDPGVAVRVEDVGTHGARVRLAQSVPIAAPMHVRLAVGDEDGGAMAPVVGRVAWSSEGDRRNAGIRLDLASKDDRLHWAKIVHQVRLAFDRSIIPVERLVG